MKREAWPPSIHLLVFGNATYIDDTCAALPPSLVDQFHKHLNSLEPCIQFTVESESEDRRLPFLDVQLCRDTDGTIGTSVYRKSTHTNQYLSFASHHPTAHKVAVVRTLMSRASALSSSGVERVEEKVKIVEALKENGYPSSFIHRHSGPMQWNKTGDKCSKAAKIHCHSTLHQGSI